MENEMYAGFAQVYDMFMDTVPYEKWRDAIVKELRQADIASGLVLDLGCGTGRMTRLLAGAGYDMIGVDNSGEMLMIAQEHTPDGSILYLQQDMRGFELYGTVRAVVSVCDSLNYILEEEELLGVFSLVNNYLDPGGLFLFDLNTVYSYETLMADNTFCENRPEGSFLWENFYDRQTRLNEYGLTLFIREESGLYRKYEEMHVQRAYGLQTVMRLLREAGLSPVCMRDADSGGEVRKDSGKIFFVARECQKKPGTIAPGGMGADEIVWNTAY